MAEIHLMENMIDDFILKWVKDDSSNEHTITLVKVTHNSNPAASTNLVSESVVKTMTYTE